MMSEVAFEAQLPTFREALRFWCKLGWISFGGPAGQIAIMHRELVESRRWVSESSFLHALQFCMLLPGPEAQQLATYLGWRMHGLRGGIAAGTLFVIPSAFLLFALSWLYVTHGETPWLDGVFSGFTAAVIVLIASALLRMAHKSLHDWADRLIAASSLSLMFWGQLSFVWIIALAAVCGWFWSKPKTQPDPTRSDSETKAPTRTIRQTFTIAATCLILWAAPLIAVFVLLGKSSTLFQLGVFFSKAAVVTFGGAYAVLPYVSQMAVGHYGWIEQDQMMAGLALAETTPGPLIMVLQFVGFLASWQNPDSLSPWLAALCGSALTTWVTFVPCFLFILVGAPYIESLHHFPRWKRAMHGISAAVIGLITHLALTLTHHTLFPPGSSFQITTAALILIAWLVLKYRKGSVITMLLTCGTLGALFSMAAI
jgi:chromate transporter